MPLGTTACPSPEQDPSDRLNHMAFPTGRREVHVSKAEQCKARANEAFKAGHFEGAIAGYSGCIEADPTNPVYFSNRAMAYLKVSCTHFTVTASQRVTSHNT